MFLTTAVLPPSCWSKTRSKPWPRCLEHAFMKLCREGNHYGFCPSWTMSSEMNGYLQSSKPSVADGMGFNHRDFCKSSRTTCKRTYLWNWSWWLQSVGLRKSSCLCSNKCEILWLQVCFMRGIEKFMHLDEKSNRAKQTPWALRQQDLRTLATQSIYCKLDSSQNTSTSRARTGCHNNEVELQRFPQSSKSEAWMDKNSQGWSIT